MACCCSSTLKIWCVLFISAASFHDVVLSDISQRLRNFDLLHHTDIIGHSSFSREKRDLSYTRGKPNAIEKLTLNASGRSFTLLLTENRDLFSPNFGVTIVKDNGVEVRESFNPHIFYKGIVQGEAHSEVFLHWDSETTINAKIVTVADTFYIEASYPHLPKSDNYSMISYKASDHIMDPTVHGDHCGGARHVPYKHSAGAEYSDNGEHDFTVPLNDNHHDRDRRQASAPEKNTCGLLLVVDTKFLKEIMNNNRARASNYVIDLIARVNSIYRSTSFGDQNGFGFQIEEIKIHDTYSSDSDHYNYGQRNIDIKDDQPNPVNVLLDIMFDNRTCSKHDCKFAESSNCLENVGCGEQEMLNAFGRVDKSGNTDFSRFCLAHLFTAYAFTNGVLGLAYIASPHRSTYGGICSKSYYDSSLGAQVYLNTGWSSAFNRNREKILTQEAEIVLAHELGHNWGSEHDPDSKDNERCSPPDSSGGKHIMFTYSVDGSQPNNRRFSECSRSSIGRVLSNKAQLCFSEMVSPTRGNFQRDDGEQCDSGVLGDECCDSQQKYRGTARCSITNDVCCKDCQISSGTTCATESDLTCVANSTCNGMSPNCTIKYKPAGDYCQKEYGRCVKHNGEIMCKPFPDVIELNTCKCTEEENVCTLCYTSGSGACIPFNPADITKYVKNCSFDSTKHCSKSGIPMEPYDLNKLGYGKDKTRIVLKDSTCGQGYCDDEGKCITQSTDIVARFWDFLSHLDPNAFVEFMRSNIVGTITLFSLIIWLPCVIVIHCYDKKQAKAAKLEEQAFRSIRRHQVDERRIVNRLTINQ